MAGGGPLTRRHLPSMALRVIMGIIILLNLCPQPVQAAFSCQGTCDDFDAQSKSYGGNVSIKVLAATNLPNKDSFGPFTKKSDPYVKVREDRKSAHCT